MTAEQRPENQRSIVVRSEQSSLEQAAVNPLLEEVGFSPQLANRLLRLNDVIVKREAAPALSRIGIGMVPGKIPIITTDVSHGSGMRIFIESDGEVASLKLHTSESLGANLTVKVEDIQDFVKALFPDKETKVFSEANRNLEEETEDLDIDLHQLNNKALKTFRKFRKAKKIRNYEGYPKTLPYSRFEVRVSDQDLPKYAECFLAFHLTAVHYTDRVACRIVEFNYQGLPKKVEDVMDKLTDLLDKHPMYPFERE